MIQDFEHLTLGAMLRLSAIPTDIEPLDRQVAILAVLSGCTEDEILALPLNIYSARVAASTFLDAPLPQRIPQRSYRCGDFTLEPVRDFKHITTAQFVDFKTFADQAGGDEAKLSQMTVELLSCMLVPKGHAYCDDYDPVDVQAAIRDHLRADDAVALTAFFLARWMRLSKRILASSRRIAARSKRKDLLRKIGQLRTMRRSLLTRFPRNGDGSASSTR